MLFSDSSSAELPSAVNGPDHKVFVQYSLGNFSSVTHANVTYQNIKVLKLWIWLLGNSIHSISTSLCNKLPPWLSSNDECSCRLSQAVEWNNTVRNIFFCEVVFSYSYAKAELLLLYTRDTAQAVFLLLLIQQERQAKWLSWVCICPKAAGNVRIGLLCFEKGSFCWSLYAAAKLN